MARPSHPSKDVESAIAHAESEGWTVRVGGKYGFLYCPYNSPGCRGGTRCKAGIWKTPQNPGTHAKQLRQVVDGCTAHRASKSAGKSDDDDA